MLTKLSLRNTESNKTNDSPTSTSMLWTPTWIKTQLDLRILMWLLSDHNNNNNNNITHRNLDTTTVLIAQGAKALTEATPTGQHKIKVKAPMRPETVNSAITARF